MPPTLNMSELFVMEKPLERPDESGQRHHRPDLALRAPCGGGNAGRAEDQADANHDGGFDPGNCAVAAGVDHHGQDAITTSVMTASERAGPWATGESGRRSFDLMSGPEQGHVEPADTSVPNLPLVRRVPVPRTPSATVTLVRRRHESPTPSLQRTQS